MGCKKLGDKTKVSKKKGTLVSSVSLFREKRSPKLLLHKKGFTKKVDKVNFVWLNTPHLKDTSKNASHTPTTQRLLANFLLINTKRLLANFLLINTKRLPAHFLLINTKRLLATFLLINSKRFLAVSLT